MSVKKSTYHLCKTLLFYSLRMVWFLLEIYEHGVVLK